MATGVKGMACSECGQPMRMTGTGEMFCDNRKCAVYDVHYEVPAVEMKPVEAKVAERKVVANVEAAEGAKKAAAVVAEEKAEPGRKDAAKKVKKAKGLSK